MGIRLDNTFTLDLPPEQAWALLNDVERIAPYVPGAKLTEISGNDYHGTVSVRLGPITAQYKGTATITSRDDAARQLTLTGKGRDIRGQGTASADLTASVVAEGTGSRINVATDLAVTGKVAQLGRGIMQLRQDFSEPGDVVVDCGANRGDVTAQLTLGLMYHKGYVVAQNDEESVRWYRRASDQGHKDGQTQLGIAYYRGKGIAQSFEEARKRFELAAAQGDALAMSNLGVMASWGEGMPKDEAGAVAWFRKAAERGNDDGQSNLGAAYYKGIGVKQDFAEAVNWFRQAAEQGNAGAQFRLGVMRAGGLGGTADAAEAAKWIGKAAGQDYPPAVKWLKEKAGNNEKESLNGER